MRTNKVSFVALLTLLVALTMATACSPQQQEVKASIDDDGREMQLKKGQTLVVTLEGNPTTGRRASRSSRRNPIGSGLGACRSSALMQ